MSAQASERRASSNRPWEMSQRGDSGTQTRITNASSAGARPHRNKPRQPMIGPRNALKVAARIVPAGSMQVESPTIQPRFDAGTNSWISGKSTAGMPPTPRPTMKRMTARKIHPPARRQRHGSGAEREDQHGCHENLAAADPVAEPAEEPAARHRRHARREQHRGRLAVGQMPIADDEGEHVADQEEVEEIHHRRQQARDEDLPLIDGERLLPLEQVQHRCPPVQHVTQLAALAARRGRFSFFCVRNGPGRPRQQGQREGYRELDIAGKRFLDRAPDRAGANLVGQNVDGRDKPGRDDHTQGKLTPHPGPPPQGGREEEAPARIWSVKPNGRHSGRGRPGHDAT